MSWRRLCKFVCFSFSLSLGNGIDSFEIHSTPKPFCITRRQCTRYSNAMQSKCIHETKKKTKQQLIENEVHICNHRDRFTIVEMVLLMPTTRCMHFLFRSKTNMCVTYFSFLLACVILFPLFLHICLRKYCIITRSQRT